MREQRTIIDEYNEIRMLSGYSNLPWQHPERIKMRQSMQALRQEYVETLESDKKLTVIMHNLLCNIHPAWQCPFEKEVDGIVDNWDGETHKLWLQKVHDALAVIEEAQKAVDAIPADTLQHILSVLAKEETNE